MQGGKPRLRLIEGGEVQVARQIAAALLYPEPVRADEAMGWGAPVLQRNRYAVEHLNVSSAVLIPPTSVVLRLASAVFRNRTYEAEERDLPARAAEVQRLWDAAECYPEPIATLLRQHERAVLAGTPVGDTTESVVHTLQQVASALSGDLGVNYSEAGDVVPALLSALETPVPEPLVQPVDIDPEDVPLRRRAVKEWQRWANARGPSSARFRERVRDAYRSTCIVCGAHYPPTSYSPQPGVDAAHILPWCDYDLDEVANGLCLCKTHHWAFDEAILVVRYEDGQYLATIRPAATEALRAEAPAFSIDTLARHAGVIPQSRLPRDVRAWPRPDFLEALETTV